MKPRRRFRPSVRLRLTLIYSGLFVLAGAALLSINYALVNRHEHKSGTAISIACEFGTANAGVQFPSDSNGKFNVPPGCTSATVKAPTGPGGIFVAPPNPNATLPGQPSVANQTPVPDSSKQRLAALANLATRGQDHTLHTLEVESGLALAFMAVASLGLGWFIAGRVLQPVLRITNTARRLSEETLHERINLDGPDDELKELADTFDAMLGRLDRAFTSQRRFVANASHELRTPLATERVLIDEALANRRASPDELRSILADLRANNEQTERLMESLLVLARSEQGVHRWLPADLSDLAANTVAASQAEAVAASVEIRSDLGSAPLTGDSSLLERLVGNLVENGLRHNVPSGGWMEVTTGISGGRPRLRAVNSGRVVDPDQVSGLFEPFRREGADRLVTGGGFGLGLSIVRSVAEAHGGRVDATARPEGGLDVVIEFPAGRPSAGTTSRPPAAGQVGALDMPPSGMRAPGSTW